MKVLNMQSPNGNPVPNQLIIKDEINEMSGNCVEYFQSYQTIIAKRDKFRKGNVDRQVWLDRKNWDYSKTTMKYLNIFLGLSGKGAKKIIEDRIASGVYELSDLNN